MNTTDILISNNPNLPTNELIELIFQHNKISIDLDLTELDYLIDSTIDYLEALKTIYYKLENKYI